MSRVCGVLDEALVARRWRRAELAAYGNGLAEKPEIVALSQVDTLDPDARKKKAASLKRAAGRAPILLSAVTREGVEEALRALIGVVEEARGVDADAAVDDARWKA